MVSKTPIRYTERGPNCTKVRKGIWIVNQGA